MDTQAQALLAVGADPVESEWVREKWINERRNCVGGSEEHE
jgi:hypothetical protein